MVRLLICVSVVIVTGVTLLLLRQQGLQLRYECNKLHSSILDHQRVLWRQQVQVAAGTAPAALEQTIEHFDSLPPAVPASAESNDPAGEWSDLPDAMDDSAGDWSVFGAE